MAFGSIGGAAIALNSSVIAMAVRLGLVVASSLGIRPATAAEIEDAICADRPGLATPTCSVPVGQVQVEIGMIDWVRDRSRGIRTDELAIGDTSVKVGVTDRLHFEVSGLPFIRSHTHDVTAKTAASGVGDVSVAAKYRLTEDSGALQVALRPFVKLPTSKMPLGNGHVEGGLILPVEYALKGSELAIVWSPEVDILPDEEGTGHHVATTQVIGVAFPLSSRTTASVEFSGAWDWDRATTSREFVVGGSLAHLLSRDLQIDAGVNLGLNRSAPDLELYSGFAIRF
jgi:hypothetical protein